jgi:hypothetical protein
VESHHIPVVWHPHMVYAALDASHNFHDEGGIARPWSNRRFRRRQMEVWKEGCPSYRKADLGPVIHGT